MDGGRFEEDGRFEAAADVFVGILRDSVGGDDHGCRRAQFQIRHPNADLVVAVAHHDDVHQVARNARSYPIILYYIKLETINWLLVW